jgi:hypothetical protein
METILRKIIRAESNQFMIEIPKNLQNQNLELIILPALDTTLMETTDSWDVMYKNSFLYYMMTHPVHIPSKPFSREEIYLERLH